MAFGRRAIGRVVLLWYRLFGQAAMNPGAVPVSISMYGVQNTGFVFRRSPHSTLDVVGPARGASARIAAVSTGAESSSAPRVSHLAAVVGGDYRTRRLKLRHPCLVGGTATISRHVGNNRQHQLQTFGVSLPRPTFRPGTRHWSRNRHALPSALGLKVGVEERGDAAAGVKGGRLIVGDAAKA